MRLIFTHVEIRVGLVVEGVFAILTGKPLIRSIAVILDYCIKLAARALKAIAPADLLEQARGACLRPEYIKRKILTG